MAQISASNHLPATLGEKGAQKMTSISAKTPDFSPWFNVFGQKLKILTSAKKDTMQKHISRGAEWRKFQLQTTFQLGEKGAQKMTSISVKTPDYSPWFSAKNRKF